MLNDLHVEMDRNITSENIIVEVNLSSLLFYFNARLHIFKVVHR